MFNSELKYIRIAYGQIEEEIKLYDNNYLEAIATLKSVEIQKQKFDNILKNLHALEDLSLTSLAADYKNMETKLNQNSTQISSSSKGLLKLSGLRFSEAHLFS